MNYKEWTTQRINFFIKIFGIFIFFFLLLQLSLNVNVTFKSNSNGAIQLYYSNSKEASASLAEYDTIRDELFPNGTNIKFAKVPHFNRYIKNADLWNERFFHTRNRC